MVVVMMIPAIVVIVIAVRAVMMMMVMMPPTVMVMVIRSSVPDRLACRQWVKLGSRCAHSITSSARAMSVGDTLRPIALAVFRLITNSNLLGRSMGSSPGFTPERIRST